MVASDPQTARVEVAGRTLKLSSLEKVMYPATETTKGEILDYYARVSPVMLTHLQGRPVTRVRWPHGVTGQSFSRRTCRPVRHRGWIGWRSRRWCIRWCAT